MSNISFIHCSTRRYRQASLSDRLNKLRQHIADTERCITTARGLVQELSEAISSDESEQVNIGPLVTFLPDGPLRNAVLPTLMESLFAQLHELGLREDKAWETPSREDTILETLETQLQGLATHMRTLSDAFANHRDLKTINAQAVEQTANDCFSVMSSIRVVGLEIGAE